NNYVDGQANRDDIYRQKEAYGSAGLKERRGDPYSSMPSQRPVMQAPAPEMTPIGEWDDPVDFGKSVNQQEMEDDMRASARISNLAQSGDDIPGVTRASIIIFQAETEPVVFELKKLVTTIGRGLDNMVIVNDQYTSRRHISLKYTSGKFELIAMSRDNLTSVNGHPAEHVILRHEDQIEIGATRIKFVVGPISDIHMMLGAPKNGVPAHMGQAPVRVRSPQTTRKNLIILISSVATIVVLMIVGLVLMILQKGSDSSGPKVDGRSAVAVIEEKGEVRHVAVVPMDDGLKLADDDNFLVEALMESVGLGAGHHRGTGGTVIGSRTKFSVSTTPVGARIYNADGSLRGTTPYHVEERVNGPREEQWTIRMDGYQDVVAQVNIDQGADLKFDLMPDVVEAPKPKPAPRPAAPRPKPKPKEPEKPAPGGGRRILL
ncbi:MAG: FHA domain-containing protein, partial [Proteobacteria bacterium]|nr:FHA domain-containing protein [Pseudomonadota bacterium]